MVSGSLYLKLQCKCLYQSKGHALAVGTFVTARVVHYLATSKIKKTDIDELTQYEHMTNLGIILI